MAAANPVTWTEPTATTAGTVVAQVLARSGGNLAANDGVSQDLALNSDAGTRRTAFRVTAEWSDPTDGSEDSEIIFMNRIAGILLEGLRFRAIGVDTQITTPFAFVISPNADQDSGLRISTVANDVYVIPQVPTDEFFLGNTIADPSVDLNRGNSRAFDIIPLGTTITALGGGGGNWINFGSNVVLDYVNATVSGLVAFSGEMRFRQAGNLAGAGNLFKMQGTFKNEVGAFVGIGSQYTFVHVGVYQADGAFASTGNLFHRICLFQTTWNTINGATLAITTANQGGFINPFVQAGVTITNARDWEWSPGTYNGTVVDRAAIYFADLTGGTSSLAGIRSFIAAGATRRFINHTGTAQSDFGGTIGLGAGATIDITFERLVAGILTLGAGQSLRVPSILFMGAAGSINLREGAADRLDLAPGDSFRISDTGQLQFGADVVLSRGAADRLDLASGDSFNIIGGDFTHTGTNFGVHGSSAPQSPAYTVNNPTTLRTIDVVAGTLVDLLQFVGTMAADLAAKGIIG